MTTASASPTRTATQWNLDPVHTDIGFSVKHMMVTNVKGRFEQATGKIELNQEDLTKSVAHVEIDVASIDTRQAGRDDHLRSADFFDAEHHPKIVFESRRIERVKDDRYRLVGDLTIRGTTRPVTLDAEITGPSPDPWGGVRMGFSATGTIDRRDYGLTWNQALETGGIAVAHEVRLNIDAELVRA